jgi:hypothetical protein
MNRVHPNVVDSPRLACLLANRASSVFRVQGGLDFNFSHETQSCRLASTRLPLGKSCEFSVQGSGWVGFVCLFKFFKMNRVDPKLSTRLHGGKSCEFSVQGSG